MHGSPLVVDCAEGEKTAGQAQSQEAERLLGCQGSNGFRARGHPYFVARLHHKDVSSRLDAIDFQHGRRWPPRPLRWNAHFGDVFKDDRKGALEIATRCPVEMQGALSTCPIKHDRRERCVMQPHQCLGNVAHMRTSLTAICSVPLRRRRWEVAIYAELPAFDSERTMAGRACIGFTSAART